MTKIEEYKSVLTNMLLEERPDLKEFILEVKEYNHNTDIDYLAGTFILKTRLWWIVQVIERDVLYAIKSDHPSIKEVVNDYTIKFNLWNG